ncbi:reverse transcriptase domain-containing protein [Tanacetum coccineum]|uniref:Reverse transcriptase domain-containing protein n=1 Tax=Tanacetum coccineum TaxID=301880 RepID=A0ABQ5IE66_9ASTR
MTTLAEHMIVVGAENHPPMLDKSMYNSWKSRMLLYTKEKKNGQIMLESIENGPLLQDDCDVQATNIVLQGLPPYVYSLVNHYKEAKDICDRVKLLMQGSELSYQEHECKLYNEFDKFTSIKGESLYEYYLRFTQLINDMHTIGMTMQQVQVNTKFLKALQPEWSKFVTDVKLAKNMHNTNFDQLYAYLSQHEGHANEARMLRERYLDPLALVAKYHTPLNSAQTSSNLRNQATIQDGRVTVQQIQGRQGQSFAGIGTKGNATSSRGNNAAGQARVVKCYNCQGERHMARQCTKLKRPRNSAWFKEKMLLVQAQESDGQATQTIIPHNAAFQTDDLDAYNSDCNDISLAKAVLMANLSSYDLDILSEVHMMCRGRKQKYTRRYPLKVH